MSSFLDKSKRTKSERQERDIAKRTGGKTTPGSGNKRVKGDVHSWNRHREEPFALPTTEMIEAKTTAKTQYTLKLQDLQKLEREAEAANKRPVLVLRMNDEGKFFFRHVEWTLIPIEHYQELTRRYRDE